MKIKEVKTKSNKERVEFEGILERVFPFKEKEGNFGQIGTQDIIVKDETDEIKVKLNIYNPEQIISSTREGEKVTITGALSIWQGNYFVFGKIKEEQEEEQKEEQKTEKTEEIKDTEKTEDIREIRLKLLELATSYYQDFTTTEIIKTAQQWEKYVLEGVINDYPSTII